MLNVTFLQCCAFHCRFQRSKKRSSRGFIDHPESIAVKCKTTECLLLEVQMLASHGSDPYYFLCAKQLSGKLRFMVSGNSGKEMRAFAGVSYLTNIANSRYN